MKLWNYLLNTLRNNTKNSKTLKTTPKYSLFISFVVMINFCKFLLKNVIINHLCYPVQCTATSECEAADTNKECSSGSCVCKTGYYSSVTGVCVQGKIKALMPTEYSANKIYYEQNLSEQWPDVFFLNFILNLKIGIRL